MISLSQSQLVHKGAMAAAAVNFPGSPSSPVVKSSSLATSSQQQQPLSILIDRVALVPADPSTPDAKPSPTPRNATAPVINTVIVSSDNMESNIRPISFGSDSDAFGSSDTLPSAESINQASAKLLGRVFLRTSKLPSDLSGIDVSLSGYVFLDREALASGAVGGPGPRSSTSSRRGASTSSAASRCFLNITAPASEEFASDSAVFSSPANAFPTEATRTFTFALTVPKFNALPPSIDSGYGRISYHITATVRKSTTNASVATAGPSYSLFPAPFLNMSTAETVPTQINILVHLAPMNLLPPAKFSLPRNTSKPAAPTPDTDTDSESTEMSFADFLASGPPPSPPTTPKPSLDAQLPAAQFTSPFLLTLPAPAFSKLPRYRLPAVAAATVPAGGTTTSGVRVLQGTSKSVEFDYRLTLPREAVSLRTGVLRATLHLQTAPGARVGYLHAVSAVVEEHRAFTVVATDGKGATNGSIDGGSSAPEPSGLALTTASPRSSIDAGQGPSVAAPTTSQRSAPRPRRKSFNMGLLVSIRPRTASPAPSQATTTTGPASATGAAHADLDAPMSPPPVGRSEAFLSKQPLSEPVVYPVRFSPAAPGDASHATVPSDQPFVMSFAIPIGASAVPDVEGVPEVRVSHVVRFTVGYARPGEGRRETVWEDVEVGVEVVDGAVRWGMRGG
ncbi:hypothetical protein HDU96_007458 [Phlyctochytrium bullatum]|nr:hypothetical protein HDU96_007458 [Phlyctochytrium bullatum]